MLSIYEGFPLIVLPELLTQLWKKKTNYELTLRTHAEPAASVWDGNASVRCRGEIKLSEIVPQMRVTVYASESGVLGLSCVPRARTETGFGLSPGDVPVQLPVSWYNNRPVFEWELRWHGHRHVLRVATLWGLWWPHVARFRALPRGIWRPVTADPKRATHIVPHLQKGWKKTYSFFLSTY